MRWPITKEEKIALLSNHCICVISLMEIASSSRKIWVVAFQTYETLMQHRCNSQFSIQGEDIWVVELNVQLWNITGGLGKVLFFELACMFVHRQDSDAGGTAENCSGVFFPWSLLSPALQTTMVVCQSQQGIAVWKSWAWKSKHYFSSLR